MGRPKRELSEQEIIEVGALASVLNQEQLADYLGVSRTTFHEIMKRDERVSVQYKKGKSKSIAGVASSLVSQARKGNVTAAIFYLKTQAGWREQDNTVTELPMIKIVRADETD